MLGRRIARRRRPVLAATLLLVLSCLPFALDVLPRLKAGGFDDKSSESYRVRAALNEELGQGDADFIALYTVDDGSIEDVAVMTAIIEAVERAEKHPQTRSVTSAFTNVAPYLISADKRSTAVLVSLQGEEYEKLAVVDEFTRALQVPHGGEHAPALRGVRTQLTGIQPINSAVLDTVMIDLIRAELIAIPLTLLFLLWVFGSVVSALLPVLLGVMANILALGALRVLTSFVDVSLFAVNVCSLLALGLAIDSTLFMVSRFREELAGGADVESAVARTSQTAGRVVFFSGIVLLLSLTGLLAFPQMLLVSIGIASAVVVIGTLFLVVVFVPALLAALGPRIDAGRVPFVAARETSPDIERSFFYRLAVLTMKRPVVVVIATTGLLLLLAVPFARMDPSVPDYRLLPAGTPAREAAVSLRNELLGNFVTPHDVLLRFDAKNAFSKEGMRAALEVQRALEQLPSVQRVISIAAVPGVPVDELVARRHSLDPITRAALDSYANASLLRFTVITDEAYNTHVARAQVRAIRALPVPDGAHIEVGGATSLLIDLLGVIEERVPAMLAVVVIVMFIVLAFAFKSLVVPLKAIVMNALSMTASFGAIVWIFQDGRLQSLLRYEPLGITDATLPIFMFCLVFGLSMDYEVLLLSRVREEVERGGDPDDAIARALAKTGRLITSAALLLILVVGAFAFSTLVSMKSLGIGMALAIAIDATVVRAVLVPATLKLLGRWNWWPSSLARTSARSR